MPMLAELVDAIVGVDTHRDTHQVEIAPGAPIAVTTISNDTTGYAQLLAWIVDHAPGPRVAVSIEGTRSYGVGLAPPRTPRGLVVVECEQPRGKTPRGRGKSDPIDAHLAVLAALRLDADRLPTPRADGDREALRSCSCPSGDHHHQHRADRPAAALLLGGDDTDRQPARAAPPKSTRPPGTARRTVRCQPGAGGAARRDRPPHPRGRPGAREAQGQQAQPETIVNDVVPGLIERGGIGRVSAAQAIVGPRTPDGAATTRRSPPSPAAAPCRPAAAAPCGTAQPRRGPGLNRALHAIAPTRMRSCPTTRAYVARRIAQGKTPREIRRCLKRYIARQLYRQLTRSMKPPTSP